MAQAFETDKGYGGEKALGLIILATDETLEPEVGPVMQSAGKAMYHSRIPSQPEVSRETLLQMEADLPTAAGLLPASVDFSVIGYGCTSASTVIGPERVSAAIQSAHPDAVVTDPITAVIAACRALNVTRLGFLTPYVADVSAAMRGMLEDNGFVVDQFLSFEEEQEKVVARITEQSVLDAVVELGASDCDAVFTSCTNLRAFAVIEDAEAKIGKPVISSNSALAWHMLRLSGVTGPLQGPGRLYAV